MKTLVCMLVPVLIPWKMTKPLTSSTCSIAMSTAGSFWQIISPDLRIFRGEDGVVGELKWDRMICVIPKCIPFYVIRIDDRSRLGEFDPFSIFHFFFFFFFSRFSSFWKFFTLFRWEGTKNGTTVAFVGSTFSFCAGRALPMDFANFM